MKFAKESQERCVARRPGEAVIAGDAHCRFSIGIPESLLRTRD